LHLQLVEPLTEDHPLQAHLSEHGEGLHHLCFETEDVKKTLEMLPQRELKAKSDTPHDGPRGRKAGFIDAKTARGVIWEMTSPS
jgi:methylmalonyl-CoA/ethylmalonyl-CoA epimerase